MGVVDDPNGRFGRVYFKSRVGLSQGQDSVKLLTDKGELNIKVHDRIWCIQIWNKDLLKEVRKGLAALECHRGTQCFLLAFQGFHPKAPKYRIGRFFEADHPQKSLLQDIGVDNVSCLEVHLNQFPTMIPIGNDRLVDSFPEEMTAFCYTPEELFKASRHGIQCTLLLSKQRKTIGKIKNSNQGAHFAVRFADCMLHIVLPQRGASDVRREYLSYEEHNVFALTKCAMVVDASDELWARASTQSVFLKRSAINENMHGMGPKLFDSIVSRLSQPLNASAKFIEAPPTSGDNGGDVGDAKESGADDGEGSSAYN